jgi:glycosyltransferase involved in cell wall biosynthesis
MEIAAGHGRAGLAAFLRDRIGYYDAVLVSRPHNMAHFRQACAAVPGFAAGLPVIYDAEAIFAARGSAPPDAGTTPTPGDPTAIAAELALAGTARMVLTVSPGEAAQFRAAGLPDVRVLGHAVRLAPTAPDAAARAGLLFVGALDEDASPNVDGLLWFVQQVLPRLDRLLGAEAVLTVIGRCSAPRLRGLGSGRVRLLGRVEEIEGHYATARLFIAPTRFAAGIPIKVQEAAAAGLPVVATALLGRQLGWTDGVELLTADTAEGFAAACHRLLTEDPLWQRLRAAALARVAEDCSAAGFQRSLEQALADAAPPR